MSASTHRLARSFLALSVEDRAVVRQRAAELDLLELERVGRARLQTAEAIAGLEALGYDASGIRPLGFPRAADTREAILADADAIAWRSGAGLVARAGALPATGRDPRILERRSGSVLGVR